MNATVNIEDIKSDGIVETTITRSSGKVNKALISRTNLNTKEVEIIVLNDWEEIFFETIEEAVEKYNSITKNEVQ